MKIKLAPARFVADVLTSSLPRHRSPLPVLRERRGEGLCPDGRFSLIEQKDPHLNPLPAYRERRQNYLIPSSRRRFPPRIASCSSGLNSRRTVARPVLVCSSRLYGKSSPKMS